MQSAPSNETRIFCRKRSTAVILAVLLFAILVAVVFIIARKTPFSTDSFVIVGLMVAFTLCSVLGVPFLVWKLFDPRPGLILNDQGLYVRPGMGSFPDEAIPWKDLRDYEIFERGDRPLFAFYPVDPASFYRRHGGIEKIFNFATQVYGHSLVILPEMLHYPPDELDRLLSKRIPRRGGTEIERKREKERDDWK
jgi:hypothetical protein